MQTGTPPVRGLSLTVEQSPSELPRLHTRYNHHSREENMRRAFRGLVRRERSPSVTSAPVAALPVRNEEPDAVGVAFPPSEAPNAVTAPTCPENSTPSEKLWSRAYKELLKRQPELVADYARHLGAHQNGDADETVATTLASPEAVKKLLQALQDDRENEQWKFSMRGKDHKVRDQLEKIVKLLALSDAVVKQALSAQPYAALAWSAVSVFLPLLSGSYAKDAAMVKGFATIADFQLYWKNCEDVYLQPTSSQHYQSLVEPLSKLYSHMLEYQIQAICQLSKKQLSRAWDKFAGQIDWAAGEKSIIELNERYKTFIDPLKEKEIRERSIAQNRNLESLCKIETEILETFKDQKRIEKEEKLLGALKLVGKNYQGGMDYNPDPVKGTCEWFFSDAAFSNWRDTRGSGVFWLTAGPGCGKSVLARTLITNSHLQGTITTVASTEEAARIASSNATVCYFFFRDGVQEQSHTTAALCAVIHHLLTQEASSHMRTEAVASFTKNGLALTESFDDLWSLLLDCANAARTGEIICVLDALDECNSGDRRRLIDKIDRLYADGTAPAARNLKFFITSRPYDDIEESFRPFTNRAHYFRLDADDRHEDISRDIGLVIDARLDTFARGFGEADRRKIREHLMSRGTKTYLWLHLTLDIIKRRPSRHNRVRDVESLLTSFPAEVSDAYEKILNRYQGDGNLSAMEDEKIMATLLQIVLAAARPLTLTEANYALTMALADDDIDSHAKLEEQLWKSDFKTTVKNLCSLLINVYDEKLFFIHLTAREFLLNEPRPGAPHTNWGGRFANSDTLHETISRCCMRYLLLEELSSRRIPLLQTDRGQYPLLNYAGYYWPDHQRVVNNPSRSSVRWARQLCNTSGEPVLLWGPINYRQNSSSYRSTLPAYHGWTDLALVSYLGLLANVQELLDEGTDVNEYSERFGSALQAAIYEEREDVVELLLSNHADVHTNKGFVGYPLEIAALQKKNRVLTTQLLSHGANPLQEIAEINVTLLEKAAQLGLTRIFLLLAATVVDFSSHPSVQEMIDNTSTVLSGKWSSAMIASIIIETGGDEDMSLMNTMFEYLMRIPDVGERILNTLKKQGKVCHLIDPNKLKHIANLENASQTLIGFSQEINWPCAEVTGDVLEVIAEYFDAATFRALYRSSSPGVASHSDLLMAAAYNVKHLLPMMKSILDVAGDDFEIDESLCFELLRSPGARLVAPMLLRYVKDIASNAHDLICCALRQSPLLTDEDKLNTTFWGMERQDIVGRVLEHCGDQFVVEDGLLLEAVSIGNLKILQRLLPFCHERLLPIQEMFETVLFQSKTEGEKIMDFLLRTYGVTEVDSRNVMLAAMKFGEDGNTGLATFLDRFHGELHVTPELLASVRSYTTIEVLAQRFGRQALDELAQKALRLVVATNTNHTKGIMPLLEYFPGSLFREGEEIVLGVLDSGCEDPCAHMGLVINKLGDQITISERILAAAAGTPTYGTVLLDMIQRWRPGSFQVTESLVKAVAAMGAPESLRHLAKKTSGKLDIGGEYYRLAEFRQLIRAGNKENVSSYWEKGPAIPDVADVYGRTTLHMAARRRGVVSGLMEFLLQVTTADVDAQDWKGWTALQFAVCGPVESTVQPLLDAGADATIANHDGQTPISEAESLQTSDARFKEILLAALNRNGRLLGVHAAEFSMDDNLLRQIYAASRKKTNERIGIR